MGDRIRVDRLGLRLAIGTTVLVVCGLAVGLYLLATHHYRRTIESRERAAELQNRVLEVTLRHGMLEKDHTLIANVLHEIGTERDVRGAMIVDHDGVVRFSSRPDRIGEKIPPESPACMVCHAKDPRERQRWVVLESTDGGYLRSVLPIRNEQACHRCHNPERRINGMMVLDVSLADANAQMVRDRRWMVAGTAALAGLLLLGIGFFMRRFILVRLARLGKAARSIAGGNLSERAAVEGNDVITRLGEDFNNMGSAVQRLVADVAAREAQLSNVMNSLDDGLVVLDRDFRVAASNFAFCRRASLHPDVLRGQRCRDVVADGLPCRLDPDRCASARCLATGKVQRETFQLPALDGHPGRVEEVSASPAFDDDGRVIQIVEVWRDITERVEEENRLVEFERLESLGALASGFSHEMNTPLASTLTCAEAILARLDKPNVAPGEIRELAGIIRREVLRCRAITEEFLRFSRGIPPAVEPVDAREAVDATLALVAPTARQAGVTFRTDEAGPVPPVMANREVVQHVFLNLLVNAVQATEGAGPVRPTPDRSNGAGGAVVVSYQVGSDVRVRIRDEGVGIAEEAQARLFEPFRTGRRGGTGIGLFLSRRFMRRFGGDVRLVESKVGAGSCFEVVFARAPEGGP